MNRSCLVLSPWRVHGDMAELAKDPEAGIASGVAPATDKHLGGFSAAEPTPLPIKPMMLLMLIVFCEPLNIIVVFPFVVFMVARASCRLDRGMARESLLKQPWVVVCAGRELWRRGRQGRTVRRYPIGVLCRSTDLDVRRPRSSSSPTLGRSLRRVCVCVCVCVCVWRSILWGWLSDRLGRRPALLLGISGTSIAILVFGFAQNYAWAIAARAMAGALSGTSSSLRCPLPAGIESSACKAS